MNVSWLGLRPPAPPRTPRNKKAGCLDKGLQEALDQTSNESISSPWPIAVGVLNLPRFVL